MDDPAKRLWEHIAERLVVEMRINLPPDEKTLIDSGLREGVSALVLAREVIYELRMDPDVPFDLGIVLESLNTALMKLAGTDRFYDMIPDVGAPT